MGAGCQNWWVLALHHPPTRLEEAVQRGCPRYHGMVGKGPGDVGQAGGEGEEAKAEEGQRRMGEERGRRRGEAARF